MLDIQRECVCADLRNTTTYSLVPPTTNERTKMRATSCVKESIGTEPLCCLRGKVAFGAGYPNNLLAGTRTEEVSFILYSIQWLSLAELR